MAVAIARMSKTVKGIKFVGDYPEQFRMSLPYLVFQRKSVSPLPPRDNNLTPPNFIISSEQPPSIPYRKIPSHLPLHHSSETHS